MQGAEGRPLMADLKPLHKVPGPQSLRYNKLKLTSHTNEKISHQ